MILLATACLGHLRPLRHRQGRHDPRVRRRKLSSVPRGQGQFVVERSASAGLELRATKRRHEQLVDRHRERQHGRRAVLGGADSSEHFSSRGVRFQLAIFCPLAIFLFLDQLDIRHFFVFRPIKFPAIFPASAKSVFFMIAAKLILRTVLKRSLQPSRRFKLKSDQQSSGPRKISFFLSYQC